MSSTETLTFGPQWLRALSGGAGVASPPASPSVPNTVKFKLAQYRYGREEMLALFEKQDEIHSELLEAPNLISEEALLPMSLIPLTEEDQRAFSGGVNSDAFPRGRGGSGLSSRGRSAPSRGRGRGRGDVYSRSMSQTDDGAGGPFPRVQREYTRRESWDERGHRGGRGGFDDGSSRKPIRRSDASEDWRSDANRGSGDGTEPDETRPEWRPAAPSRRESWRDQGRSGSGNWREINSRTNEQQPPFRRSINRTRSLSSKYDQGDSGLMPEWAEDADDAEVGVFTEGSFQPKKAAKSVTKNNSTEAGQPSAKQLPLERIEEKDKPLEEEKNEKDALGVPDQRDVDGGTPSSASPSMGKMKPAIKHHTIEVKDPPLDVRPEPPAAQAEVSDPDVAATSAVEISALKQDMVAAESSASAGEVLVTSDKTGNNNVTAGDGGHDDDPHLQHLEQTALKLVDSLSASDDQFEWGGTRKDSPSIEPPLSLPNPGIPGLASKWFYKDPQGDTQGPFGSSEMNEWFLAGYFTLNLLVKRACDPKFVPLGDLIAKWGGMPFDDKHGRLPQPSSSDLQLLALQQQQQQKQIQLQQQQKLLQQQQLLQQQEIMRNFQQQQQQKQAYANTVQHLTKLEDFRSLPAQQQRVVIAQYMQVLQQQPSPAPQTVNMSSPAPIHSLWDSDSSAGRRPSPVPMVTQQQQQQIVELLKQEQFTKKKREELEEQKIRELKEQMRREEEKKIRELQEQMMREEERKIREAQEQLLREEEQKRRQLEELKLKQMQEEALRLEAEEARKKKEDEEKRQAEILRERKLQEEQEKLKKEQEEKRRKEEQRRKEEEEKTRAKIAKLEEEARKRKEQEEERKRKEAAKRQEEERKRAEKEIKRKMEEEKEKQRKQKEKEKLLQLQIEEEEKKQKEKQAQEAAAKKQIELQKQKDEAWRRKQQEQLKDMRLPATANWAQSQQQQSQPTSLAALAEIQKKEEEEERKRQEEQMRIIKQQQQQQRQAQQKGVWGGSLTSGSSSSSSSGGRPMSLMEIQMEEAKKMKQKQKVQPPQPKSEINFQAAAAWGGRQPNSSTSVWGYSPPVQPAANLWEQSNPPQRAPEPAKPQNSRGKRNGANPTDSSSVSALFKQASRGDQFTEWCEGQMKGIPASKSLDVSTLIGFLREIDSPFEVKDYVTLYLGDTKASRDFAEGFIQRRNNLRKQEQAEKQTKQQKGKKQDQPGKQQTQPVQSGSNQNNADDVEVVTGSTKRGKRKQKKLQKVDPSILGFSVNAASDRVNMGEIETPNDG